MVIRDRINLSVAPGWLYYDYSLTVTNTVDGLGWTSVFLNRQGSQIAFMNTLVDEASGWYFAKLDDVFTDESIRAGDFVSFGGHPNYQFGTFLDVGYYQPFYLAVASGRSIWYPPDGNWHWDDPVFGWGLFQMTIDGLRLEDSAVAYGSQGIVVGRMSAVPEATPIILLLLGGLILRSAKLEPTRS